METYPSPKPIKLAGIILAAGMGTRMGATKQLLPLGGRPVLEKVIQNGLAAHLDPLILVLGYEANKIMDRLFLSQARVVINPRYKTGMSSSIKAGLAAIGPLCDGAMFLLGDQPLVDQSILKKLIQSYTNQAHTNRPHQTIVIPTFRGRQGNPVIFGRHFFPELNRLTGDIGGRVLFKTHPEKIIQVSVETNAICFDLDTPEDYETLCQHEER
ncbi:MAG: nucleotidyltransferase family protein [Desulfobacteraceae bacterium]|nr:nucleotidyltransferase family protein [Desulfobacteraceae bacterium]